MNTNQLATKIYNHVNSIQTERSGRGWDQYNDLYVIDEIEKMINKHVDDKKLVASYATPLPKFKDEWGNTDWRDTGEMGG